MNADTYEWEYEDHGPGVPADSDDEPEDTPIVGMSVAIIEAAIGVVSAIVPTLVVDPSLYSMVGQAV